MYLNSNLPVFEEIALFWLDEEYVKHAPCERSRLGALAILQSKIFPHIGGKLINEIAYQDILNIALLYSKQAPSVTKRGMQFVNRIFIYARDIFNYDIINPVREGLALLYRHAPHREYPHLDVCDVPTFFQAVENARVWKPQTKTAFWLIAYTALRRNEVMLAKWQEIDFENKKWTVPVERMKMKGGHHTIPLSNQIIDLLCILQEQTDRDEGSLFDINPFAPLNLCHSTGYSGRMCLHGLRKIFSTHANESNLWRPDAIEVQLAHQIRGVRGVYNKAQYFQERAEMMSWYADELDCWRGLKK